MKTLYQTIERLWVAISKVIFVRFQFEIPAEELHELNKQGKILFALPSGGIFEWLILSSWCRTQKISPVLIANRKEILLLTRPIWFLKILFGKMKFSDAFLSSSPGPRILFCPPNERKELFQPTQVESLLSDIYAQAAVKPGEPFFIVPIFILWRKYIRGEGRKFYELILGLNSNPNWVGKLWYLLRKRQDSSVKSLGSFPVSERPSSNVSDAEMGDVLEEGESLKNARIIRRKILVLTQQEMRVVLGPRYLPPPTVKENLMRDPEVQKAIEVYADKNAVNKKKAMMIAYRYLTEIVANYTYRFIEFMEFFLGWLFNRVFDGLVSQREDISRLRETMKTKPVVFVSCHRSHLDYLVVPFVLFSEDMITPHIAAGINLAFWPVGYFLRMGGAFFIRRSFKGNDLYALLLKKYIEFLLKNRTNIKFFIEGTRSRSGKLLPPAYGMLKMILEIFRNHNIEDIALVPVSICYDEVFEESSYSRELQGGAKKKESATGLLSSRKIVKRNFGKVYVRFAEAVSVKEVTEKGDQSGSDPKLTLQKTAFRICKTINDVTPITPKSIICSILLTHRDGSLALSEILRIADRMADYVEFSGANLSTPNRAQFRMSVENALRNLQKRSMVDVVDDVPRSYVVDTKKRAILNLYKNNSIHCFVLPSIAVLAFLDTITKRESVSQKQSSAFYDDFLKSALSLREILKFEFFFSPRLAFPEELLQALRFFNPDVAWATSADLEWEQGFHRFFKDWKELTVYSGLLGELLESYLLLLDFIKENAGEIFDKKQFLSKVVKFAQERLGENLLSYPEAISVQNFSNGQLFCENRRYLEIKKTGESTSVHLAKENSEWDQTRGLIVKFLSLLKDSPEVSLRTTP